MLLYFLILICICLITGYFIWKNKHSEVAHLLGIFGTLGLCLALILAPWQILLLLLITVLVPTNFKYHTNKPNSIQIQCSQQPISKFKAVHNLIYRGAYYCANSNTKWDELTPSQGTYKLSYRGSTYLSCIHYCDQTSRSTSSSVMCQLRFRGSSYYINKTTPIKNQRSLEFKPINTTSLPITH